MDKNYFMYMLIPFDLLVDIDIGIVRTAQSEYYKNDKYDNYLDFDILSDLDKDNYKFLFEYRTNINPLYIVADRDLPKEKYDILDDIYNTIIEEKYVDVLNNSELTAIHRIIASGMYSDGGPFRVTIICKNELEASYVRSFNFKSNIIICKSKEDICDIDMNEYKYLFIKDIKDLEYYGDLKEKVLFIANYRFNKEYIELEMGNTYILNPKFILNLISDNIIKTIDVYPQPDDIDIDYE